ncbi:MAG: tetratricopeptide repeat protein [Rickettsiales bacterium]
MPVTRQSPVGRSFTQAARAVAALPVLAVFLAVASCGHLPGKNKDVPEKKDAERTARPSLEKKCDGGDVAYCYALAASYERSAAIDPSMSAKASETYKNACDKGFGEACIDLGIYRANGTGGERDLPRAAALFGKACDEGKLLGCANLAEFYLNGVGVKKDAEKAKNILKKSCDKGFEVACMKLRGFKQYAHVKPQPQKLIAFSRKAQELRYGPMESVYRERCEADDFYACHYLGVLYLEGQSGTKDPALAAKLFKGACDHKVGAACSAFGAMYVKGAGDIEKDVDKAGELFEKGCDVGDGSGCFLVGVMHNEGKSKEKSPKKAAAYFAKGCDLDDTLACNSLGLATLQGAGVDKDAAKAAKIFDAACAKGQPLSCTNLGLMYAKGVGVEKDGNKAARLLIVSCKKGDHVACAVLKSQARKVGNGAATRVHKTPGAPVLRERK